jgi:hypothetical protein
MKIEWASGISVPDWWMRLGGEKRKKEVKEKYGIEWEYVSSILKEMIYKEEVKIEGVSKGESQRMECSS